MNPDEKQPDARDRDEPVKIDLPFEDAMRGLLKVDPDAPPAKDDAPKKRKRERDS